MAKYDILFSRLKILGKKIPFLENIAPLYRPLLHRLKYYVRNKSYKTSGYEVLRQAHHALHNQAIVFWLEFGTLLGVVREGKLIKHDLDIDIGIHVKDYSPKIKDLMIKAGFEFIHFFETQDGKGMEESYTYRGVTLDIFYFDHCDFNYSCDLYPVKNNCRYIRRLFMQIRGFKKVKINQISYNIPANSEERLVNTYGNDWKIPDKNWYTPEDALNSQILNQEIKITLA